MTRAPHRRAPHLSSKLQGFGTTIFAEMSALAAQTGALNLGQGFPDTDGPEEVREAAVDALRSGAYNQYPPLPGHPDLRDAIAEHQQRFWNLEFDPADEILVTAGATEALAAAMLALCETGDDVVVFDPTYDCYAASIAMAGARIRPVVLRPTSDGTFGFDPEELRRAFTPRTKLILLNTPHNPTGKVFTSDELQLIADLCAEHEVVAVTDEVYEHLIFEHLAFDGRTHQLSHQPLAGFTAADGSSMRDRTLTVSSAGKSFSFTGWKIGWVCGPAEYVTALRTAKQFLTFVNGGPFQPAVAVGLRLGEEYFDGFRAELQAKRDLVCNGLEAAGFEVFSPQGTYFATIDCSSVDRDGIQFCLDLPKRAGVVAVPSAVFYQDRRDGASLVRFCFAKQDAMLEEAMSRMNRAFT